MKKLGVAESLKMSKEETQTNFSLVLLYRECIRTIDLHHNSEFSKRHFKFDGHKWK